MPAPLSDPPRILLQIYDGDLSTKWLDLDFLKKGVSAITFEFDAEVEIASYRFYTGNDFPERVSFHSFRRARDIGSYL